MSDFYDIAVIGTGTSAHHVIHAAAEAVEAAAKKSGRRVRVNRGDMTGWPSSRRIGQKHAAFKVIFDEETGEILGAQLLGHHMDEAINVFALAIRHGLKRKDLLATTWAYPTFVSDLKYTLS